MNFSNVPIQGNVLAGLLAAFFWGGGDFSGGMASQHAGGSMRATLRVILLSHLSSLVLVLILALMHGDPLPHGRLLAWGLAAGVTAGISLVGFYIALARGAMGAPAAVSGLLAAAVPSVVAAVSEGFPGLLHLAGFTVAGLAIWIVAAAPSGTLESAHTRSTMILASVSGAGFGIYFVALKIAGAMGPIWPMACARIGSLSACSLILLGFIFLGKKDEVAVPSSEGIPALFGLPKRAVFWAFSTALLDSAGNLFYVTSTRSGRLDVAAVLASLYPATTILLASFVLKEHLSRRQIVAMAIAVAAVVMITL